jgi:hypothetical protein
MARRKFGDDVDHSSYNLEADEFVCYTHIEDVFLKESIKGSSTIAKCDYCNKVKPVIKLSQLLKLIVVGINFLFEDPNEFKYYDNDSETGFDGDNFYFDEMFQDRLNLEITDTKLYDDIYEHLNNNSLYYCKDEYGSHTEYLTDLWEIFKHTVKHKARYVFYYQDTFKDFRLGDPVNILHNVQKAIQDFKLFKKITTADKLYRCRQHSKRNEIKEAKDIASPPYEYCRTNNRMSAIGVSMFYGSLNEKVCIKEVVDYSDTTKPYYSTGYFNSKTELNLVDLTKLPAIPSIYDEQNNHYIDTIFFLREFIEDISKPVRPSDSAIEYVPTQVVTEYIKFNPSLKADGIIYPSSKGKFLKNIVLFKNQEECIEDLDYDISSLKIRRIK